jgi:photosystem II stability/assembly factor-like uncharacterized protein
MVFGAILALIGIYLLATGKIKGGKNKITLPGGIVFELSAPALIIFIVGCGLFISPFVLGPKTKSEIQTAGGTTQSNPVVPPPPTNMVPKVTLVPESVRFFRCLFLEQANLLVVSGVGRSFGETSTEPFVLTSSDRGETFAVSKGESFDLGRPASTRLCGSEDGHYLFAASLGPDGRVLVSRNKGQSWDVRRLPQETAIRDVSCSANGKSVWVVCASNVFCSMDFGNAWQQARIGDPPGPLGCVSVSSDGGEIWIGGGDNVQPFTRHSRDSGRGWENTYFDSVASIRMPPGLSGVRSLATANDGGAWALLVVEGPTNRIVSRMSLRNGGYKWMNLPESPYMTELFTPGFGRKLFGTGRNGVSISLDGGIKWDTRTPPEPAPVAADRPGARRPLNTLSGICGTRDGNTLWAVGFPGWIVRSTDGGGTWSMLKF